MDHARRRNAGKREGRRARVPLDDVLVAFESRGLDVIDLNHASNASPRRTPRGRGSWNYAFSARCPSPKSRRFWEPRTRPLRPTGGSHEPGYAAG